MALADNIISYWKMDGNSNDSLGLNSGSDTSITYGVGTGIINNGAVSNGGKITINDSGSLDITNAFTISIWVKALTTTQTNTYLLSKLNNAGTDNVYSFLYEYVNDTIEFYSNDFTGTAPRTGSQITLADTNWHHIVYTYDGTTWAGYKDGVNIFSVSRVFSLNATTGALYLFTFDGTATGRFNGTLDEFGMWSRGLSSNEVLQLYNSGAGLQYPFSNTIKGIQSIGNIQSIKF